MFDLVKHVDGWTKLACHVYDMVYCVMMIIAIYNMKLEDMDAQCMMWQN
jgi:hypothetical protein